MDILKFNRENKEGAFKILNATNGGPWHKRHVDDQYRSNLEAYKAARMPFSRNHDSGVVGVYGGPYSYDVSRIFPNFDADENDPKSYDFACTDEAILVTLDAGTETFFRLGETIEHQIKKHATLPPADFEKWARICEHIIRHYNFGWADGFELNIKYWEIWNEPDLDEDDSPNKRTWGGTKAQYFDLYETAAKHLKKCFPELKIGGPALAFREDWAEDFLSEMSKRQAPLDFFSWHIYCWETKQLLEKADRIKKMLTDNGFGDVESILNEWNYVKGWTDGFTDSIKNLCGIKGAAFVMACISSAQKCDALDMLMYYDTRPSIFCGVFDFYTCEPIKGYYPLMWYGKFYDMEAEIRCEAEPEDIYTLCGKDADGKLMCVVTHYSDKENVAARDVRIDFSKDGKYEVYLLDSTHDGELVAVTEDLSFSMDVNTCILIKEI